MKNKQFLALALLIGVVLFAGSCRLYQNETHLYTVDIEISESPTEGKLIDLGHQEKIRVEFTSDTEIYEAHALLFEEDSDKFNINEDNVEAKSTISLLQPVADGAMDGEAVLALRDYNVDGMEHTFEQEIDLSDYQTGTCFVLFAFARPDDSHIGYSSKNIYFCKKN